MKISYLDFEKPISELEAQTQKLTETHEKNKNLDISKELSQLEGKTEKLLHEIYDNLNAWQISQVSRHPQRPYTLDYIEKLANKKRTHINTLTYKDDTFLYFLDSGEFVNQVILKNKYPNLKERLLELGEKIADSRVNVGIHFPSDSKISKEIAETIIKNNLID